MAAMLSFIVLNQSGIWNWWRESIMQFANKMPKLNETKKENWGKQNKIEEKAENKSKLNKRRKGGKNTELK